MQKTLTNKLKTNYKTIKEVFYRSREKFANDIFITQKFNQKGKFEEITYKEYTDDVIALGTALINKYNLKDERVEDFAKAKEVRKSLYEKGFSIKTLDGERTYSLYKRSPSKSKGGSCMFIWDELRDEMIKLKEKLND